ncbi:GNVR domain-containing protein [Roseobacter sp. N2S]|uniref:GumC family protein n=1 Tax=Roseobacter sp. N2S TaxID=2663844 RepID=UPI002861554A|nr:GNVR domain-containing protein [Roseobacter sp. N2S]MDR6267663.1 polysaccharide chain length determinant protein (PEP-CTERM system associated) [Roseobacter sp. N2S]
MNFDLKYYLSIFFRRFPIFFIVTALFSVAAVSTAYMLPTNYQTQATLLVESAQIPDSLAASTVQTNASEQLQIFEQRMMTRANLLDIANSRQVFADGRQLTPDQIVSEMRRKTVIRRSGGSGQATLMTITFKATDPVVAAQVTNDYVTLLLRDSIEFRTDKAGDTLSFFEEEVARLNQDLDAQSEKILNFKNANSDALPEELEYRLGRQSLLQERLSQLQREKTLLGEQRTRLVQIFEATGNVDIESNRRLTPAEQELRSAQDELEQALTVYSEENPRVKLLQAKVARLEKALGGAPVDDGSDTRATSLLDIQLSEIDTRLEFVADQATQTANELEKLRTAIEKTPANSIALDALQRDYENVQLQYNSAINRLSTAATGERIEVLSKGQRVSVIEQAVTPTEPTSPNRPLIAGGGTFFGILAGIGAVFLLEMMNRSVRRATDLTRSLGITPLATFPYTRTPRQAAQRRAIIAAATLVVILGIPALLYFIHTFYLPLDLIIDRITNQVGL